ncbi:MogA/MoaB family molybdenum cofactor biosynthesis protein [Methanococcoides sp. FTZ1]|uniref:MogA/MoaB family molybdenum cofactor biosynthesis protein n=1 Tax=Methanococcoides sp. FTZ1 TaxID=3439061 RepID=UPI003F849413
MDSVTQKHKKDVKKSLGFYLISISTSRFSMYGSARSPADAEDVSGELMEGLVTNNGHDVVGYELVSDDPSSIRSAVKDALQKEVDIIVTTGGTGLTPADVTIEAVSPMFEKQMPGFGELFRYRSIEQIGSAVILTRAAAGIVGDKAIFCLPGSPGAVELALSDIIIPEAGHVIKHIR